MHGVTKETSTTTQLRVVFDASARSQSGVSHDTQLPVPSLYPKLTTVLNHFRRHSIGLSADVSKMFTEVVLDPSERDLHRFLVQQPESTSVRDCRVKCLTFGVALHPS